jgi:hypothetical protein
MTMKNPYITSGFFTAVLSLSLLINPTSNAQDPNQSVINISKITSWVKDDGFHDWIVGDSWNGAYPKGTENGVIFSEGIVWGGLVYDGQPTKVRVNGNTYGTGCSPITRLYRVRADYSSGYLISDAASFFNKDISSITNDNIEQIKNQYEKDWNEWPAEKGAPYFDIDGDGKYNPYIDVPGVPGAVQTIWINYNDSLSEANYGSPPIGLEIQETYWAYTDREPLGNIIYKKVDLIYKGTSISPPVSKIDSMYICQWSDPDIFSYSDDLAGCDTILNLGYAYNNPYETIIYPPPYYQAAGYTFLQGVSKFTGSIGDSAVFNFKWRKGYKFFGDKPLSSFIYEGPNLHDIVYNQYYWTLAIYNIMRGFQPEPIYPAQNPFDSTIADYTNHGTYLVTGDPITDEGKLDGIIEPPGERRLWLISTPFSMNLGDTAEVVIALVGGMGDNNLSSITNLRYNTKSANLFYNYFVEDMTSGKIQVTLPDRPKQDLIPDNYVLYQNFPNPFNSGTTIKYNIPEAAFVSLVLYDVLGREVKRLVNEEQQAGKYTVKFEAGDLSSGVYFYKISFNNLSNKLVFDGLNKTMKLILMK